jgi:hypothetical protein
MFKGWGVTRLKGPDALTGCPRLRIHGPFPLPPSLLSRSIGKIDAHLEISHLLPNAIFALRCKLRGGRGGRGDVGES